MKKYIAILLIIFFSCNKNNTIETGQIEIVPTYCKYINNQGFSNFRFKLFKKGEKNTEIKLTAENKVPGKDITILSKLEYGDYYIEYKTIYNHKNVVEFKVNQQKTQVIKFCVDYLDSRKNQNILLIDEQEIGQTISIEFLHQGCFDSTDRVRLNLTKTKDNFIAEYEGKRYNLSKSQVNLIREFEIELRSNHDSDCSDMDSYGIFTLKNYQSYSITDSSCRWKGFENLLKMLKIKP